MNPETTLSPDDPHPADMLAVGQQKPHPRGTRKSLSELIIAVDFDGTVVTHEYPGLGREIGAAPVLKRLVDAGSRLILWTMRSGLYLEEARGWFRDHGIHLFGCQRNPEQDTWTDSPKAYAHIYIDDAAFGAPLLHDNPNERPYLDWKAVERVLFPDDSEE